MESCTHVGHIKRLKQANIHTLIKNKLINKYLNNFFLINSHTQGPGFESQHQKKEKEKTNSNKTWIAVKCVDSGLYPSTWEAKASAL